MCGEVHYEVGKLQRDLPVQQIFSVHIIYHHPSKIFNGIETIKFWNRLLVNLYLLYLQNDISTR